MWAGSITLAERKAAQGSGPAYMYMLTWETPAARGSLRCPHALEIPLVFDNVERARDFVGRQTATSRNGWPTRCPRRGSPSPAPAIRTTAGLPDWPAYDARRRATMVFDLESQLVDDPWSEVRQILQA